MKRILPLVLFLIFLLSLSVFAQSAAPTTDKPAAAATDQAASTTAESDEAKTAALAKAAQNPIASLISVPLQNNTAFGVGQYDRDQNVLNIQPVIPVRIGEWAASCASDRSRSISQLSFIATQYIRPVVPPGACGCKFSSFIRKNRSHEEYQGQKTMGKT